MRLSKLIIMLQDEQYKLLSTGIDPEVQFNGSEWKQDVNSCEVITKHSTLVLMLSEETP